MDQRLWDPLLSSVPMLRLPMYSCRMRRLLGCSATAHGTTGTYTSVSDSPEQRKNPALYTSLQAAPWGQAHAELPTPPRPPGGSWAAQPPRVSNVKTKPRALVKPEVLAPAGGWPQLRAAVENGADAVYFGLTDFNARARANNFTSEELPDVMAYLHDRGVKGFVTLNVLVFDEELARVEDTVRTCATAGVDALIVQDLGVVELARAVAPGLPIHGSTQMSITSAEGAEFAAGMGVERVVVGRELSVREIAKVADGAAPEVEAFVHGALCVSYSGQCFSSEAWGGRSANRGQCAQACRLPYGLLVDGQLRDLADAKYLLSPQDLAAVEHVPELILAGVTCFKIEGRLKGPEYVALTTQVYRNAVDSAWEALTGRGAARRGLAPSTDTRQDNALQAAKAATALSGSQWRDLQQVFARGQDGEHRGLTPGFLEGVQHQRLVRGRAPRHRGVFAGRVVRVVPHRQTSRGHDRLQGRGRGRSSNRPGAAANPIGPPIPSFAVLLEVSAPLKKGDGVVFDAGAPEEQEQGTTTVAIVLGPNQVDPRRVQPGDLVWRTKDSGLESRLVASYDGLPASERRRAGVTVRVSGSLGHPLAVTLRDEDGREAVGMSGMALVAASSRALTPGDVAKAVGAVGGDGFRLLADVDSSALALGQGLFLPVSELKGARRAAAEALVASRRSHTRDRGLASQPVVPQLLAAIRAQHSDGAEDGRPAPKPGSPAARVLVREAGQASMLRVLCRTPGQVTAALRVPWLQELVLDFLEVQGLKEAVAEVRAAGKRVVVATPRILKPDEERLVHFYLRLRADGLLVRSAGLLHQLLRLGGPGAELHGLKDVAGRPLAVPELQGDFSLNAANALSAAMLLNVGPLAVLAPTHDLSAAQICALAERMGCNGAARLEAVLHHHLPIFHTEHCVFARFLSDGNSYRDCGHPCERHGVHLRDASGADHLLLADMGCRNTLFNAAAQSGAFFVADFLRAGLRRFRIELTDQPPDSVAPLLQGYRDVLDGRLAPGELWNATLKPLPDANGRAHGVTSGSLGGAQDRDRATFKVTAAARRHAQHESNKQAV